jgi:cytochrome c peroxidase
MKKLIVSICAFIGLFIIACNKNERSINNAQQKEIYLDLSDTAGVYFNNSYPTLIDKKITLGRVLFYDKHLSLNNAVSCGSCHKQQFAFADNTPLSRGFEGKMSSRNSLPIQNLLQLNSLTPIQNTSFIIGSLLWDSREVSLKQMVLRPVNNHIEMGIKDMNALTEKLNALSYYNGLVNDAYETDVITPEIIAESLSWFLASIRSDSSRFDLHNTNNGTLTALELQGMNLFTTKYDCVSCHMPFQPYNGNIGGSDIGLDLTPTDIGMAAVGTGKSGAFRIPNLHNVGVTAPYMHDGRFQSLDEVLDHYSHGIQPSAQLDERLKGADDKPLRMNISSSEKKALIAFLNSMTDYTMLTNSNYSNPFKTR